MNKNAILLSISLFSLVYLYASCTLFKPLMMPKRSFFEDQYWHCVCEDAPHDTSDFDIGFHAMHFSSKEIHKISTSKDYKKAFILETWTSHCGYYSGSSGNGFVAFVKQDTGYVVENFWAFDVKILKTAHNNVYDFEYSQPRTGLKYYVYWDGEQFISCEIYFPDNRGGYFESDLIDKIQFINKDTFSDDNDRRHSWFAAAYELEKVYLNKHKKQPYFWLKPHYFNQPTLLLKKTSKYEYALVNGFPKSEYAGENYIQLIDSLANGYKILTIRDEKDDNYETTTEGKDCKHVQFWEWNVVKKQYIFAHRDTTYCLTKTP